MKNKREKDENAESGSSSDILKQDQPEGTSVSPEVKETSNQGCSVIKRGIEMEAIESPRLGKPGPSIAVRGAAGGGSYNPSAQVGRSPANPERRTAGTDPLNKMDIRDELEWNEVGAAQFRTLIEGAPAGFDSALVLGNWTYKDNPVFQLDNQGLRPGKLAFPYRRRIASMSKDQLFFIAGQHDSSAKGQMKFYPTSTYSKNKTAAREVVDLNPSDYAKRSNYLIRGMKINILRSSGRLGITSVAFDSVELPCESSANDLDVRQDNARVYWDVNDKLITETLFDLVNKPENLAQNKYSPIPDGQPDALQHLLLAQDIANLDACIAFSALRSAMETYAYNRDLRVDYGAGNGARAQARAMLAPLLVDNSDDYDVLSDNADCNGTPGVYCTTVGYHNSGNIRFTMPEYIQTFLDSPTKYNSGFGVWLTQPRGLRLLFEEAQKAFDSCQFIIDKDTYHMMDDVIGWRWSHDRRIGVSKFGIIAPFDPNQIYVEDSSSHIPVIGPNDRLTGKFTMVDFVLNGSMYNQTQLRSPLVDAILEVVRYRMFPKLTGDEYNIYIPFDFGCDRYGFGQAVIMEAIPYVHQMNHSARAVFERFESQYGINPLMSDLMQPLTLADVMKTSSYKGLGMDGSLPEASEFLKLIFADPEGYSVAYGAWDDGILDRVNGVVGITFSDFGPISDSIDEPQKMLFPMMYQGMTIDQLDMLVKTGPEKYLKTRDMPIHRYQLSDTNSKFTRKSGDVDAHTNVSINMPFFEFQKPQEYVANAVSGTALKLSIYDVLCKPRVNGRMAPAPRAMLDFVMCNGVSPKASASFKTGHDGSTSKYGWRVSPGASKVFTTEESDDIIRFAWDDSKLKYVGYDIENYRVNFIYADTSDVTLLGAQLKRFFVHVNGGNLSEAEIGSLVNSYAVYLSPNQSMQDENVSGVTIPGAYEDVTIAAAGTAYVSKKFTTVKFGDTVYSLDPTSENYIGSSTDITVAAGTGTHILQWAITNGGEASATLKVMKLSLSVDLGYTNPTLMLWTMDNLYPFVKSPFEGVTEVSVAQGETYRDSNMDIGLMAMFGLAGYQGLWYDRLNLKVYGEKQEVGGRIYDNRFLHESNILFT